MYFALAQNEVASIQSSQLCSSTGFLNGEIIRIIQKMVKGLWNAAAAEIVSSYSAPCHQQIQYFAIESMHK